MREVVTIGAIYPAFTGAAAFQQLAAVYPAGVSSGRAFDARLPSDDPRVDQIERILRAAGLSRQPDISVPVNRPTEYPIFVTRQFDPADLDPCPLLELHPADDPEGVAVAIFTVHEP